MYWQILVSMNQYDCIKYNKVATSLNGGKCHCQHNNLHSIFLMPKHGPIHCHYFIHYCHEFIVCDYIPKRLNCPEFALHFIFVCVCYVELGVCNLSGKYINRLLCPTYVWTKFDNLIYLCVCLSFVDWVQCSRFITSHHSYSLNP